MKTFVKVFPDFINDKLYLKRKFTDEEQLIIENIFNEILKRDGESAITQNGNGEGDPFPGSNQTGYGNACSEYVYKRFIFKKEEFVIFFIKIYPESLTGPDEDSIKIIAHSPTFNNISIGESFDVYLKYDKNNLLTEESKSKIYSEIIKPITKSINKVFEE